MSLFKIIFKLILIAIVSIGCSTKKDGGGNRVQGGGSVENPDPTIPNIIDIIVNAPLLTRYTKTTFNIDSGRYIIENIGWCDPKAGQTQKSRNIKIECNTIYDYSKIRDNNNKVKYIYRLLHNYNVGDSISSLQEVISSTTSDSKKWNHVFKDIFSTVDPVVIDRSLNLRNWKEALEMKFKLDTYRCLDSRYLKILLNYTVKQQGNRLLDTDNIFYFDNLLNTVTALEIDLSKSKVVSYPLLIDASKSTIFTANISDEVPMFRMNEITQYGVIIDDINPYKKLNFDTFKNICSTYYNSINAFHNIYSKRSLSYFPTYHSKYDAEISNKVDERLSFLDYRPRESSDSLTYMHILDVNLIKSMMPVKDNLTDEELNFLNSNGFSIYTKMEQIK